MACGSELGARGLDGWESAGIRFRERRERDHQTPCRVNSERTQRAGARCIEHRDPSARARCKAPGPGTESAADRHVRRAPAANITTKISPGSGTARPDAQSSHARRGPGSAKPNKRPGPSPIKSGPERRDPPWRVPGSGQERAATLREYAGGVLNS